VKAWKQSSSFSLSSRVVELGNVGIFIVANRQWLGVGNPPMCAMVCMREQCTLWVPSLLTHARNYNAHNYNVQTSYSTMYNMWKFVVKVL
jgi:hypothetical protein